jgi:uncharacterized membrane protein
MLERRRRVLSKVEVLDKKFVKGAIMTEEYLKRRSKILHGESV